MNKYKTLLPNPFESSSLNSTLALRELGRKIMDEFKNNKLTKGKKKSKKKVQRKRKV